MCVGIDAALRVADGDPEVLELGSPHGSGTAIATPMVGMADEPTRRSARAAREADPLVDVAQGGLGDLGGPLGDPARGCALRWAWSSSSSRVRSRNGVTNSTTTLGEVLLQVAVAAAGVLLLEVGDQRPDSAE